MAQTQEQQQQVNISINEIILAQLRDLKETQRDLKAELKDVRQELKETRKELNARLDKQDEKIEKLNEKIDETRNELSNKIDSSSSHGQIATITTIGIGLSAVSITLGVLYTLFLK